MNKLGGKKKRPLKRWRVALAITYAGVLAWCAFNVLFPSSAIPVLSFDYAPHSYYWTLTIPPNPRESFPGFPNDTAILNVTVSAPQPFADHVPITVTVTGCERPKPNGTFDTFVTGFTGAYDDQNPGTIWNGEQVTVIDFAKLHLHGYYGYNCPSIGLGSNPLHVIGDRTHQTLYFENPGTYPVSIKTWYWPNLYPFGRPIQYNYTSNTIDVQPSATINQGVRSEAEAIAVIASAAFLILELSPEIKERLSQ